MQVGILCVGICPYTPGLRGKMDLTLELVLQTCLYGRFVGPLTKVGGLWNFGAGGDMRYHLGQQAYQRKLVPWLWRVLPTRPRGIPMCIGMVAVAGTTNLAVWNTNVQWYSGRRVEYLSPLTKSLFANGSGSK